MYADDHSHVADSLAARRGVVLHRMQRATAQDPTIPVRRLFNAAAEEDSGDSDELPAFSSVRSRVKRIRSNFMPPIPSTIDDVVIDGHWSQTWSDNNFLSFLDNDWGIAIFVTTAMLRVLQRADCLFIDGTFRTAPHPYVQFLTVHGSYLGHVIPLVFCLVTGKTTGQYRQIIQHLKSRVRRVTHRRLRPTRIVLDFEQALMTALGTELPTSTLSGCYFHFNQSLWRHLQQIGLASHYRHDRRLKHAVRKVMAMGFLPVVLIRHNFTLLHNGRRTQRLIRQYPAFGDWLDYIETTYMSNNSAFPPPIWNVYGRNMETRTNNHLEGTSSIFFLKFS